MYRSYCHLDFVAQAVWEYATRFEEMPQVLHFGGSEVLSFFQLIRMIVGYEVILSPRDREIHTHTPRPPKCGFDISLWRKYKLPVFTPQMSVERLLNE
jgi:hypothetical protein